MPRNASASPRLRALAPAMGLMLLCGALHAHEPRIGRVCLQPNTVPQILSTFTFTPGDLLQYRAQHPLGATSDAECPPTKSCGIVDDWQMASEMAGVYCNGGNKAALTAGGGEVSFMITGPSAYNLDNHHDVYRFGKGSLTGSCYVCVARPTEPAAPGGLAPVR